MTTQLQLIIIIIIAIIIIIIIEIILRWTGYERQICRYVVWSINIGESYYPLLQNIKAPSSAETLVYVE